MKTIELRNHKHIKDYIESVAKYYKCLLDEDTTEDEELEFLKETFRITVIKDMNEDEEFGNAIYELIFDLLFYELNIKNEIEKYIDENNVNYNDLKVIMNLLGGLFQ